MPDLLADLHDLTQAMIPVTGAEIGDATPCEYCLNRLARLQAEHQAANEKSLLLEQGKTR